MHSLSQYPIQPNGNIAKLFVQKGIEHFYAATQYIQQLPYGRNTNADFRLVITEQCGTCSTKHAILAQLAKELQIPCQLMLGIYAMNEKNTPKIGAILKKYDLVSIPEAHCYLMYQNHRLDYTQTQSTTDSPFASLLYESQITPEQIGHYKQNLHRAFIAKWLNEQGLSTTFTTTVCWEIREACIAALAQN